MAKKKARPRPATSGAPTSGASAEAGHRSAAGTAKGGQTAPGLASLRRQLDALDHQLLELANRRAEIDRQLRDRMRAKASAAGDAPAPGDAAGALLAQIHDSSARIDKLLECNSGPLPSAAVRGIFQELFSACLQHQRAARVGYLGPAYSYSHQAAWEQFGSQHEQIPLASIAAVFDAVHAGHLEFGVVPLENSTDGRIADTFHMLSRRQVVVAAEIPLAIHHCLLGRGPRSSIRRVCSKPQALSQCRQWLADNLPQAELVPAASSAVAAEAATQDPTTAAIASRQAAVHYGLQVLADNIEDQQHNVTRFAVLAQQPAQRSGRDKTLLLFQVRHEPGALADVMNVFKRQKINLTWIESFPLHDRPQEYFFLAELQGHAQDLRVRRTLASLHKKTEKLQLLGSFAAAPAPR